MSLAPDFAVANELPPHAPQHTPPTPPTPSPPTPLARVGGGMAWLPFAMVGAFGALLVSSRTRPFAVLMAQENYPIELLTFAILIVGGVLALRLARRMWRVDGGGLWAAFYGVF